MNPIMNPDTSMIQKQIDDLTHIVKLHKHLGTDLTQKLVNHAGGSDTQIQFNDGGILNGQPNMTYDKSIKALEIAPEDATANDVDGGPVTIFSGYALGGNAAGGNIDIFPGDGAGTKDGGTLLLRGGVAGSSGNTGDVVTGGDRGHPGQVPSNASNGGFLVIPFLNGAPTGTPSRIGACCFDYTNNKLYIWNGAAWKSVTLT